MRLSNCHCGSPANCVGSDEYGKAASGSASRSVPPRWLALPGTTVTQASRPTVATPVGSLPTRTVRTELSEGSMRSTLPLRPAATQTSPSPYATPVGDSPTAILRIRPVPGSNRETVPSGVFAAHTEPPPTATPWGPLPMGTDCVTVLVRASTSSSCPVDVLVTHMPRRDGAIPPGAPASGIVVTSPLSGSIRESE